MNRTKTTQEWLEVLDITGQEFTNEMRNDFPGIEDYSPTQLQEAMSFTLKRLLEERPWAERYTFTDGAYNGRLGRDDG